MFVTFKTIRGMVVKINKSCIEAMELIKEKDRFKIWITFIDKPVEDGNDWDVCEKEYKRLTKL